MKIGIIGASLSGLVAGKKLAFAGHDVTVFEQSAQLGHRLATKKTDTGFFDYGKPYLKPRSEEFQSFAQELKKKEVLFEWTDSLQYFDGSNILQTHPNKGTDTGVYYASKSGINAVVDYLKRWVDVKAPMRAGGLTHIGPNRSRKRSWMINLTDRSVFECDGVIIAADAANATGVLNTAQDETQARRLLRYIDEIPYKPRYALMLTADIDEPEWAGIECEDAILTWIGNDSSKSEAQQKTHLTIQSTGDFAENHRDEDEQTVTGEILNRASQILDTSLSDADTSLHFWRFYEPEKSLNEYFMELEMEEAPLALTGDYFSGRPEESAYISGSHLADYWINKFETEVEAKAEV